MYDQSQDKLERVAKMRRIKNPKRMSKEELIIVLLKSKHKIPELFNSNLDDNKIGDTRRILNRVVLPKRIRNKLKKRFMK